VKTSLKAEIRKLRYQRSTYGILAAACAIAAISAISIIATAQLPRREMFMHLTDESTMHLVMSTTTAGYIFALVVGIVMSTTEFRHSTAVATYLAQPHRRTVMIAKMIVAAVAGGVVQLLSTAVGMIAAVLYVQRYPHFTLQFDTYLRIMAGSVLVGVVLAVVGVAVGQLIRSQMVAVVVSILWLQLVEGLIVVFADWLGKWSMRGAITSVLDVAVQQRNTQATLDIATDQLGPWQSVLLLMAYGALFAVVATATSMRRDVD
jgi:ABC-type transport system involved in multi-copper enzyme maturation permease subunit